MTLAAPPLRCSSVADELAEPMIGSVDQRVRWLLVEDRSAWGEKAVRDVVGAATEAEAKQRGLRLLLVRRREGDPAADALRRAFLCDTASGEMAVRTVTDVAELSLDAATDAPVSSFGTPLTEPMFLVCTNGKRDACCAVRGRVLMSAMAAEHGDRTWECSHLGGHRFAASLVCLPHGLVYGRVTAADGPRLASAYLDGRLDPELLRGRSPWPAPAQVAEQLVRRERRLTGVDDVRLLAAEVGEDEARLTLATPDAGERAVVLRAVASSPARPVSCRADEMEEPVHWVAAEGPVAG